ncbi:hypothetical protein HS1genome_0625 [Sulfodiicoccus acidiphilus]|uniref:Uncharacterized protein n=1 Tax=Sulfodiicoccus acidiphilus TaxID=1670455 RepID=A0A348B234_9CREN|nr:hypothetical protein [Sulfodiicoccus acidiphilus]BBD72236.1 hypothetical protein HS1genome_0625 [Sulfodiicoccus acidiphilus]
MELPPPGPPRGSLIGAAAGREEPFHLTVEEGKGSVTVVRVNPDPPEFGRYFSRASEGRVEELYVGLLRGSEVQVVDNPSNVFFDDPLVRVELRAYLSALPGDRWYRVYVSDPSERGVEATLKYAEALEASAPGGEAGAFVVNMVPPLPEEYAQASSRVGELKFPVRAVVPFDERLYTYGSFWDFGEFPEQVARLGRVLLDMPTTATVE